MNLHWSVLILAIGMAQAEPVSIHTAAGRIGQRDPVACTLSAFGGSEIEVRWLALADQSVPLVVRQLSSSRSVKRLTTTVDFKDGESLWKWSIPPVRGIARYRVELGTTPPVILSVTAWDKKAHDAAWKSLGNATVTATGLPQGSESALKKLGLRIASGKGDGAALHLAPADAPARTLVFHDDDPGKSVWIAVPTGQGTGWKGIVPLSCIDADTLASDEGRIHLLSLLTENPETSSLP